jgi:hypothetical protein
MNLRTGGSATEPEAVGGATVSVTDHVVIWLAISVCISEAVIAAFQTLKADRKKFGPAP